jgi:hypothetical protein
MEYFGYNFCMILTSYIKQSRRLYTFLGNMLHKTAVQVLSLVASATYHKQRDLPVPRVYSYRLNQQLGKKKLLVSYQTSTRIIRENNSWRFHCPGSEASHQRSQIFVNAGLRNDTTACHNRREDLQSFLTTPLQDGVTKHATYLHAGQGLDKSATWFQPAAGLTRPTTVHLTTRLPRHRFIVTATLTQRHELNLYQVTLTAFLMF